MAVSVAAAVSLWADLRNAIRQAILLEDRVNRLTIDVDKFQDRLVDHDRRVTRIEALIAFGFGRRLPPER